MINIKDVEEKKVIIAYLICKQCRGVGLEHIFRLWNQRWSNDFVTENGTKLKMHNHKIIISKRKLNQGTPLPKCCEEYDMFLDEIYKWINEKYDSKVERNKNADMFKEMIFAHREQCRQNFYKTFNDSNLKTNGYKILNQISKKHPLILSKYCIFHTDKNGIKECVFSGSYENAMCYLKKKMEDFKSE